MQRKGDLSFVEGMSSLLHSYSIHFEGQNVSINMSIWGLQKYTFSHRFYLQWDSAPLSMGRPQWWQENLSISG